jgi:hypothetical protein
MIGDHTAAAVAAAAVAVAIIIAVAIPAAHPTVLDHAARLDDECCRCTDYARCPSRVKDCVRLTWRNVSRLSWLPPTRAYRQVAAGKDLPWWHPLVSGDPETVIVPASRCTGIDLTDVFGFVLPKIPTARIFLTYP